MTEKKAVFKLQPFPIEIPLSEKCGTELDHMGLITYPHGREQCPGCAVNRAIREMTAEAIREMLEKVDKSFMEKRKEGRRG